MASPLEIKIALHYWFNSTEDYAADDERHRTSPAVVSAVDSMVKAGLLEYAGNVPGRVEAGPALATYVAALRAVPFPVQQWVIPKADETADGWQGAAWSVDHVLSAECDGVRSDKDVMSVTVVDERGVSYCGVVDARNYKTPTA